jgi:hypothetical protein
LTGKKRNSSNSLMALFIYIEKNIQTACSLLEQGLRSKIMYGKLKRLKTDPAGASLLFPLRTEEMVGQFENRPVTGQRFVITGDSLTDPRLCRYISTSPVVEVQPVPDGWIFQTENSRYSLTLMEEE